MKEIKAICECCDKRIGFDGILNSHFLATRTDCKPELIRFGEVAVNVEDLKDLIDMFKRNAHEGFDFYDHYLSEKKT